MIVFLFTDMYSNLGNRALVGVNGKKFFLLSRNGKSTFVFILLHIIYDILVLLPKYLLESPFAFFSKYPDL